MITLTGIDIEFDLTKYIRVSDLIYYNGPLLSHFISTKRDSYLFYWVDSDMESNRWLVTRVSTSIIQQYLDRKISLYSIITEGLDPVVIAIDIDASYNLKQSKVLSIADLDCEYLPEKDSLYEFEVKSVELKDSCHSSSIHTFANGLLEIHFKGKGISYGSIPLELYSEVLFKISCLQKSMADRFILLNTEKYKRDNSANTKNKRLTKKEFASKISPFINFKYELELAGSIRVLLRPIESKQYSFTESLSDIFSYDFISLLTQGANKQILAKYANKYGYDSIKRCSDFLMLINKNDISANLQWTNSNLNISYQGDLDKNNISIILENIDNIGITKEYRVELIGMFTSINTKTLNYSFQTDEDLDTNKSNGYFIDALKEKIKNITFKEKYALVIKRQIIEKAEKDVFKDVVLSIDTLP